MTQRTNTRQRGFTLIELMLSMTFVAVLLLTIALSVIQMGTIYNRGMAIKEVNQAARDIADDLRRSVQATGVFAITATDADTTDYVRLTQSVNGTTVPVSGRLCLGNYSYIWNTATAIETSFTDRARYLSSAGIAGDAVNFVKIADTGKKYCAKDVSGTLLNKNIVYADIDNATELLTSGDHTIHVLAFNVTTTDAGYDATSGQRLYQVLYALGTGDTSAMAFSSGVPTRCLPPDDPNANLAYCNVQQFGIVLRAGNTVN